MSDPTLSRAPSFGQPYPHPQPGHASTHAQESGKPAVAQRRIMGIQPTLFVAMCLLAVVTLVTVVLIFTGDFGSQSSRVVWTVLVFLGFTGLLAFDLNLSRKDSTPLVVGVAGNTYLLGVLMLAIWMKSSETWGLTGWLGMVVFMTFLVVRAAVAGAWGLLVAGRKSQTAFGVIVGRVAAVLLGLSGVMLTFHYVLEAFGAGATEFYWRTTVAVIVVAALAASVTVLLFWNRRNLDWQEREAAGMHAAPMAARAGQPPVMNPRPGQVPAAPVMVRPGPAVRPASSAPAEAPAERQRPQGQEAPGGQPAGGLLPWPVYPDGTPYPAGPDGQPVFPSGYQQ